MHLSRRGAAVMAAIIITAGCTAALFAQANEAAAGSLGELTAEIRQLRIAIEQSTRTQTQAQALGIFLSAQQSRILQVTTRLDAARKELEAVARQSTNHASHLAGLEEQIPKISDPNERAALEDRSKSLKLEMKAVAAQEQQVRIREAEMVQAWQQEEARWNDLIARLQQIVER
jgi:chromosome segregation ATPase